MIFCIEDDKVWDIGTTSPAPDIYASLISYLYFTYLILLYHFRQFVRGVARDHSLPT